MRKLLSDRILETIQNRPLTAKEIYQELRRKGIKTTRNSINTNMSLLSNRNDVEIFYRKEEMESQFLVKVKKTVKSYLFRGSL